MERPSRRRAIDTLSPVNAHRRVDRAGDVFHVYRAPRRPSGINDLPAGLVGLADDRAALDAAARQHARMNLHVMFAALARLAYRPRRAAELAHRDDQRLVEQRLAGTVFGWNAVEVFDQIAERDVEFADQHRVVARAFLVDIAVVVPAPVAGQNEARPGVGAKEIAGQDQRIADGAAAVTLLVLVRDGHHFGHARVVHNRPRATVIFVIVGEGAVGMAIAAAQRIV